MNRYLDKGALFRKQGHRVLLWRTWDPSRGAALFIGVNPSTAGAKDDDPTVRREVRFAVDIGCGTYAKGNLFGFTSSHVEDLLAADDPIGNPENDAAIVKAAEGAQIVILAWGSKAGRLGKMVRARAAEVLKLLAGRQLHCLRLTKDGSPEHPLRLPAALRPIPYELPR